MYIELEGRLESRFEIGKLIKNSAFPFEIEHKDGNIYAKGLTKREYFAAMALQGILANKGPYWVANAQIAEEAVMIANELIESLNDTNNPNLQP